MQKQFNGDRMVFSKDAIEKFEHLNAKNESWLKPYNLHKK